MGRKKKEIKTIDIGELFEENKKIKEKYIYYKNTYKSLFECYGRPSYAKHEIFNYYKSLLEKNADHVEKYGVCSFNHNFIFLHAEVEKNGKKYYLYINPTHNYYMEIGNEEREIKE